MADEKLTPAAVEAIGKECLFARGEPTDGHVVAEGIMTNMGFHPGRLAERRADILALLMELPEEFRASHSEVEAFDRSDAGPPHSRLLWGGLLARLGRSAGEASRTET